MAQTAVWDDHVWDDHGTHLAEHSALRAIIEGMTPVSFINPPPLGRQFWIPIRKRTAWQEAIEWLEARKAAREEWPFPW
jgi:hypothetical protein